MPVNLPTQRSAIVVSSVSPLRWEPLAVNPAFWSSRWAPCLVNAADLVQLDEHRVETVLTDAPFDEFRIVTGQIVRGDLDFAAEPGMERGPAGPVVLIQAVFNADDRIPGNKMFQVAYQVVRRERFGDGPQVVFPSLQKLLAARSMAMKTSSPAGSLPSSRFDDQFDRFLVVRKIRANRPRRQSLSSCRSCARALSRSGKPRRHNA